MSLNGIQYMFIHRCACRVHVPYRNSMMTLVLRDSLGGNCRTVMVATISGDAAQMEESISTCRFAQRVALVTNEVRVWHKHLTLGQHLALPLQAEPGGVSLTASDKPGT